MDTVREVIGDAVPTPDDAAQYRTWIAELHRQLRAATETADRLGDLGDTWHTTNLALPGVGDDGEHVAEGDSGIPGGARAAAELTRTLADAGTQAYVIAGHYRRVAKNLHRDLHAELNGDMPPYRVLALDAIELLGYSRPADEWLALGAPLDDDGQDAAHLLQQAGLLPEFDEFFAPQPEPVGDGAAAAPEEGQDR
jgi:hypothetical protein